MPHERQVRVARFYPLLLGPLIEAPDRGAAELIAAQRHGADAVRVISHLDLELDREEQQIVRRRRLVDEE